MARKSIGKTKRFEIFKRDLFTCQYCGRTPPNVVLELDHIHPVAKGGSNDNDNLITACMDCNRGKSDNSLEDVVPGVREKAERLREQEAQLRGYNQLLAAKKRRETRMIGEIEAVFQEAYPDREFTQPFRESIRHNFIPRLNKDQLMMAIYKAVAKCSAPRPAIKYFCGVCWGIIKEREHGRS